MNVKDSIKKVGAVAASTLMVGMTMGAAQSLSEFPGMFVDDEGSPTAQVVVGSQGAVSDVVGAVNVAAALGQATIQTSEQTEEVSVQTSGGIGWSVDGDGTTMDTRNDNLYFGDSIDEVRDTLTDEHLDALQTVEFQDDAGNSQDVDFFLRPQQRDVQFGTSGESNVDPFLHVSNPDDPGSTTAGLYELEANFEDGLEITESSGDGGNDDVLGEDIELFGKSFTISQDSFSTSNAGELILFGSQEEYDLETGESTEFEIGGETHSIEVRAVTDSSTAAFYVDGNLQEETEGNTVNVAGTDVRVDDVIQTSSDNSEGLVTFSIGSEEYRISADGDTIEDEDGDDIEGTYAELVGVGSNEDVDNDDIEISTIRFGMGAVDDDSDYVGVGEAFQDPMFDEIAFSFGGLAPDAGEGAGDSVGEVEFSTDGDDTVTASVGSGDESATLDWAYTEAPSNGDSSLDLADSDDDPYVVYEGSDVYEDDYVVTDAGDFPHVWEVTSIDRDTVDETLTSSDEATIDLRDAVSGAQVEVDLDAVGGTDSLDTDTGNDDTEEDYYAGTEVIDGQTYKFVLEGNDDQLNAEGTPEKNFRVAWGDGSSVTGTNGISSALDYGAETSIYPAVDVDSEAALALTTPQTPGASLGTDTSATWEFPSTESTDAKTLTVTNTTSNDLEVTTSDGQSATVTSDGDKLVTIGQTDYIVEVSGTSANTAVTVDSVGLAESQTSGNSFGATVTDTDTGFDDGDSDTWVNRPAALVLQPEDDNDEEHGYVHVPGVDTGEPEVDAGGNAADVLYTGGPDDSAYSSLVQTLDSDDDMDVGYNFYGTHTMQDTEDQGSFTLHVPNQQAVAGAAFHGAAASFGQGGSGTGTGEVTYTGVTNEDIRGALPDMAKTDEQVTSSDRQNSHMILVGGPAVNTLVADLADDGETWTAEQWRNEHVDEALLQVVEDAFADGQHAMIVAGHSADDTRAAARYISEWRSHQDTLADAGMQYSPSSQEAPR